MNLSPVMSPRVQYCTHPLFRAKSILHTGGMKMGTTNYAKALLPRIKKINRGGISLNEIFRRAEIARSNWSRWMSGDTAPTMKTHDRFVSTLEKCESEIERKARNGAKHKVDPNDL
jgi:hypothetical protein